jgi:hypothetical protein
MVDEDTFAASEPAHPVKRGLERLPVLLTHWHELRPHLVPNAPTVILLLHPGARRQPLRHIHLERVLKHTHILELTLLVLIVDIANFF